MARKATDTNALVSLYTERITEPATADEVYGYWVFLLGLLASIVGVALFLYSSTLERGVGPFWTVRQLGIVLAAGGVPLLLAGVAIRLPLRRLATTLTYLGVLICLAALAWFVAIYPGGWSPQTGEAGIIGLYTVGLAVIGLAAAFVPMLSPAETRTPSEQAERERERAERNELRDEAETAREEADEARTAAEAASAETAALRESKARFEIYTDRGGGHRWRLRHRNGNIIATSGEAYASRQKCQQGMHSVMRNALGADVMTVEPEDPESTTEEVHTDPIELESRASFELFEDNAGEWRWRLVHDNGNIIADSGEGYASKSNARRAMSGIRDHAASADYLRIDPAGFELYRDAAGEWRWRLVHENGNVIADSGQGYASRQKARQGAESVKTNAGGADIEEQ